MDRLAERSGNEGPWPGFGDIDIAALARGFCCPAQRVTTHEELVAALDDAIPTLAAREEPMLLDVVIAPTTTFAP
jgi:benzoylformate decarboxylase